MRQALRAVLVHVVGWALILFGVLGLVLPLHPGLLFIAAGLAVISVEAGWARRLLAHLRTRFDERDLGGERLDRWRAHVTERLPDGRDDEEASMEEDPTPGPKAESGSLDER